MAQLSPGAVRKRTVLAHFGFSFSLPAQYWGLRGPRVPGTGYAALPVRQGLIGKRPAHFNV